MTHEEAKKFLTQFAANSGSAQVRHAVHQLLHDFSKLYIALEQLAEPTNNNGHKRLRETGKYDYYNSPLTVEIVHKLIQEL